MSKPLLELKNINMVFQKRGTLLGQDRKFHVLKDVDMEVYPGEIVALVGESGCGKTTLGKIMTGLLKPTSGKMYFEGKPITLHFGQDWNEFRHSVQFIQQDSYAALNPARTIFQSLCAAVESVDRKLSAAAKERHVVELLEAVGLLPAAMYLHKYPHQLSGGQRQRILMARALAMEPKLIIADEPVSMIDVSLRISILDLMLKLNREKQISFVYITHDLATAKYIANDGKIVVMYLGEVVEKARLDTLLEEPKHPYTQALISAVPIPDPKIAKQHRPIPIRSMDQMSLEKRGERCSFYDRCPYAQERCKKKVEYRRQGDEILKCALDTPPEWTQRF